MKTLLSQNVTLLEDQVFLFQPEDTIAHLYLRKNEHYPAIICEKENKNLRDLEIRIKDYRYSLTDSGLVYTESLEKLFKKFPWYFEKIYNLAKKENFVTGQTFVYETVDITQNKLFCGYNDFQKNVLDKKVTADDYDRLYLIPGYKLFIEQHFKGMTSQDGVLFLWNFITEEKPETSFRKFLFEYLMTYNRQLEKNYEERMQNAEV